MRAKQVRRPVPERSNGTDCKSVTSVSKVRILLSPHFDCFEISGSSSVGRATAFQAVGRGFEPRLPLNKKDSRKLGCNFVYIKYRIGIDFSFRRETFLEKINILRFFLGFYAVKQKKFKSRCSSGVEYFLGKEGVRGSIPLIGSILKYN